MSDAESLRTWVNTHVDVELDELDELLQLSAPLSKSQLHELFAVAQSSDPSTDSERRCADSRGEKTVKRTQPPASDLCCRTSVSTPEMRSTPSVKRYSEEGSSSHGETACRIHAMGDSIPKTLPPPAL